jgi:hypothetical protein
MTCMCSSCRDSLTQGFVRDSQQPEIVKGPVRFVWVCGIDRLMLEGLACDRGRLSKAARRLRQNGRLTV